MLVSAAIRMLLLLRSPSPSSSSAVRCRLSIVLRAASESPLIGIRGRGVCRRQERHAVWVDLEQSVGSIQETELPGFILFLGLLPSQGSLSSHHPLPLGDQGTLSAGTVSPSTVALVALESRHDPVVATSGALWGPRVAFGNPDATQKDGTRRGH